ncbi:MAG: hypothetical protein EOO09_03715 [Chitinophagaceae bacterium]|nr:MAG: hypothetical protein EOO09_03715 [Chitinophagaceae bacterium]
METAGPASYLDKKNMAAKRLLREYFLFSHKDRLAVITLLILIALAWCLPYLFAPGPGGETTTDGAWTKLVDSLLQPGPGTSGSSAARFIPLNQGDNRINNAQEGKLFRFDPNTLGENGWRELGLRDRTIETILKYRGKGGQFREPADLEKIYGLSPGLRNRLLPFVRIAPGAPGNTRHFQPMGQRRETSNIPPAPITAAGYRHPYPARTTPARGSIDLNNTDTSSLVALPCIGSKLAARILQFRDRLGGFHSVEQLREVYGITDSAFQVIRPFLRADAAGCRLIAINEVSLDELKKHPYLRFDLARTIISYRQEHGGFRELDDLQKMTVMPAMTYEKIRPYLRL